jgi:hypothetical protein
MESLPSERFAVLTQLNPAAATDARTSTYVKPDKFARLCAMLQVGDASATATFTLIKAADTSGTNSAAVATAAVGGTGTVGDNKITIINAGQAEDFFDADRPYFAIGFAGGALANAAGLLLGFDPKYAPPAQAASVTVAR